MKDLLAILFVILLFIIIIELWVQVTGAELTRVAAFFALGAAATLFVIKEPRQ